MTREEILTMLRDSEAQLDVDAVIEFISNAENPSVIEDLQTQLETEQSTIALVSERINLSDSSELLDTIDTLVENQSALESEVKNLRQSRQELQNVVAQRRNQLTDRIKGLLEHLHGEKAAEVERFTVRARTMNFEQLDVELEEMQSRVAASRPSNRVSQIADGDQTHVEPMTWQQLTSYRL